jgi:hypothetical protein
MFIIYISCCIIGRSTFSTKIIKILWFYFYFRLVLILVPMFIIYISCCIIGRSTFYTKIIIILWFYVRWYQYLWAYRKCNICRYLNVWCNSAIVVFMQVGNIMFFIYSWFLLKIFAINLKKKRGFIFKWSHVIALLFWMFEIQCHHFFQMVETTWLMTRIDPIFLYRT